MNSVAGDVRLPGEISRHHDARTLSRPATWRAAQASTALTLTALGYADPLPGHHLVMAELIIATMAGRHSDLQTFAANRDHRQLFARDVSLPAGASLLRIERGQAPELRALARAGQLICPIPDCPDPRYTTRGGARTDHFVHLSLLEGAHNSETWYHYTAKRLIGEWLSARYPEAHVSVDAEAVANRQVPDVMASFPDGTRCAFEVQYSPISIHEWSRRHVGYRAQGITDVWLLGHTATYFEISRSRHDQPYVRLGPLTSMMWRAGQGPYWINPDTSEIATPVWFTDPAQQSVSFGQGNRFRPVSRDLTIREVAAHVDALAECTLGPAGFRTPADEDEERTRIRINAARSEWAREVVTG